MVPPGAMPPGAMPPGLADTKARDKSEAWSPWASLGAGLLLASGVTWLVTSRRRRLLDVGEPERPELERRGDDQRPRG